MLNQEAQETFVAYAVPVFTGQVSTVSELVEQHGTSRQKVVARLRELRRARRLVEA
jgi:DNA-binding transcriptional regulator GbsR (MarR family)